MKVWIFECFCSSKELKALHNRLSVDLLEDLPLPFIITMSSCTRDSLRRSFSKRLKFLEMELPNDVILKCDLDFRDGSLRRIVLHVPHPMAPYKAKKKERRSLCVQLDTGINFFSWLLGRGVSQHDYFLRTFKSKAPIVELYQHRDLELTKRRPLEPTEFEPSFLTWVKRYTRQDPALVVTTGSSIVRIAIDKLTSKMSKSLKKRGVQKKSHTKQEFQKTPKLSDDRSSLDKIKTYKSVIDPCENDNQENESKLMFLYGDVTDISRKSVAAADVVMPDLDELKKWWAASELWRKWEPLDSHRLLMYQLKIPESLIDEMKIPRPMHSGTKIFKFVDDSYEYINEDQDYYKETETSVAMDCHEQDNEAEDHNDKMETSEIEGTVHMDSYEHESKGEDYDEEIETSYSLVDLSEQDNEDEDEDTPTQSTEEKLRMTRCHGTAVEVSKNGTVTVHGTFPLTFHANASVPKRILATGGIPKIYFTPTEIQIRIGHDVMFSRSNERLLASSEAWLPQLIHEREILSLTEDQTSQDQTQKGGAPKSRLVAVSDIPSFTSKVKRNRGHIGQNAELKRRLLQGDIFHCTEKGRQVFFKGVRMSLPQRANLKTVHVQASLVPEGELHEHECVKGGQNDDPAHRLGIFIKFDLKPNYGGSTSYWHRTFGDQNIKVLNSLVDFLEDKGDDWTESQPRRWLGKDGDRVNPTFTKNQLWTEQNSDNPTVKTSSSAPLFG